MRYRVWDTDLGKLFGVYDTEEEALGLVRLLAESYGKDVGDIAMTCERDDGSFGEAKSGATLVARAEEVAAERERAEVRRGEVIASGWGSRPGGSGYSEPMPLAAKGYLCPTHRPRKGLGAPVRGSRRSVGS